MEFEWSSQLAVGLLGLIAGVLSGMLGISGSVLMVPLLLFVLPLVTSTVIPVGSIGGIAITQGLFSSASGVFAFRRTKYVNGKIARIGGTAIATGSLAGGVLSRWSPDAFILIAFAILTTLAAAGMLVRRSNGMRRTTSRLRRTWGLGILLPMGLMAGMVGVGGGFLTLPLLNRLLRVPLTVAIATTLAINLFSAGAGFAGKAITGQVPLWLALAAIVGAVPGAQLGVRLNRRIPRPVLLYLIAAVLVLIAIRIWWEAILTLIS